MTVFRADADKFYMAQQYLIDGYNILKEKRTIMSGCTSSYPKGYEYKSEVSEICNSINDILTDLSQLERNVSETKEKMMAKMSGWAATYFETALNNYNKFSNTIKLGDGYVSYISEQYNSTEYAQQLKTYYEILSSSGEFAGSFEEFKLIFEYQKDKEELAVLEKELEELYNNPITMPSIPGGRISEAQGKAYKENVEKYYAYKNKLEELEEKVNLLRINVYNIEISSECAGLSAEQLKEKRKELEDQQPNAFVGFFTSIFGGEKTKDNQDKLTTKINIYNQLISNRENYEFSEWYKKCLEDPEFQKKVEEGKNISKNYDANGMPNPGAYDKEHILNGFADSWAYEEYMSQEEIDVYYYVLATNNTRDELGLSNCYSAGQNYLEHFENKVNQAWGQELGEAQKAAYEKANWVGKAFMTTGIAWQQGLSSAFEGINITTEKLLGLDDIDTTVGADEYAAGIFRENLLAKRDEDGNIIYTTNENGEKVPVLDSMNWKSIYYDTNQVMAHMAPAIVASTIGGPGGQISSTMIMWTSSYGNKYKEMINQGYSDSQASDYAFVSATAETALEKITSAIPGIGIGAGTPQVSYKALVVDRIKDILIDAGGEVFQDTTSKFIGNQLLGQENDLSLFTEENLNTLLVSICSSVGMGGGSTVTNAIDIHNTRGEIVGNVYSTTGATLSFNDLMQEVKNGNANNLYQGLSIIHESAMPKVLSTIDPSIVNDMVSNLSNEQAGNLVNVFGKRNMNLVYDILNDSNVEKIKSNYIEEQTEKINLSEIGKIFNDNENLNNKMFTDENTKLFTVKDFAMILPDIGLNIFNLAGRKSMGSNLTAEQNQEILNKIKEEGIVHITSEDSANKILDSNYVKKTKAGIQSYGAAKSFFFAGTPTIEGVAFNLDKLKPVMTGIKIRPTDVQMSDLKVRLSDGSIFNKGDFKFENGQAEQVYYGLTFEDGNLVYKEITAEQAQNYQPDVTPEQLKILQSKWALGLKTFISGMQADRVKLLNDIQKYKGQPVYNEITEQLGTVETNKKYADDNMIVDGMSCHMLMPDLLIQNLNNKGISDVFTIQDGVYVLKDVDANTKFQVLNAITDFVSSSVGQMVLEDDAALAAWNVGVGKDINSRGNMAEFLYNQGKVEQANIMLTNLITKVNDFRQQLITGSIEQVEQIETLNIEEKVEVLEEQFNISRKQKYVDMNSMSFEEQAEHIKNCHNEDLIEYIWQNEDIMKNHKELIKEKIITNQDYYCSRLFDMPFTFSKMGEFYNLMSDAEIISNLNNRNLSILIMKSKYDQLETSIYQQELNKRLTNGSIFVDFSPFKYSIFGLEMLSNEYSFSILDENIQNSLIENINNEWNKIPESLKTFEFSLSQKAILINLYNNQKINENSIELINEFYESNPLSLKGTNINYEMFNSDIINVLGKDLVMEFAPYSEMSTKIISLYNNNPQLLQLWVDAHNQFCQDNSLNNVMLKTKSLLNYFYENQNNLASLNNDILINDSFINYVLYDNVESYDKKIGLVSRIKLDYSQNYEKNFIEQCDKNFNLSETIEDKKNYYCQKYYKMSYAEINYIVAKYLDNIDSLNNLSLSDETQIFIDDIKRLIEIDSIDSLTKVYNSRDILFSVEESMAIEQELRECYMSSFVEKLSTTSNKLNNSEYEIVDYNGKQLRVIETDDNFSFFVHSSDSGFVVEKELVNNSFKETWRQIAPNTHGLSTSYISDINIGSAPVQGVGVLYAFTDINSDDIQLLAPYDVNSHIANYGFSSGNKEVYMSPDNLSSNTLRLYNEAVLNRATVKPNYIIIFDDMSSDILDNSYKAAAEWNIPLVKIDKVKLAQNQMNKVNKSLNLFKVNGDISLLIKAIELYDSAVAGYNLNIDQEKNNQYLETALRKEIFTNTTENHTVKEILSVNNPNSFINNYINQSSSETDLINLKQFLSDLKSKYELMNQNGTMVITRTKSSIDIDNILTAIEQRVESLKNQNLLNCSNENFSTILNQLSQEEGQIFINNLSVEELQTVLSKVSKDNYVAFSSILSEDAIINNIDKINHETFDKLIEIIFSNPYTTLILSQNETFLNAFVQRSSDSVFKSVFESGNGLAIKLFNKLDNTRLNNILSSIQDKNCFDSLFKDFYNTETILAGKIESIYAYSVLKSNGFNTNDVNEYFSWLSNEHAYNINVSFATSVENNNGVYNIRRTDGSKFDLKLLNTQELSNGKTIYSYEYSSIDNYGVRSSIILYFDFNLSFMLDENIGVERLINDFLSMDRLQQSINNFGYLGSYKLISGEYEQVIDPENISLLINETANQYYDFLNNYYDLDAGTTFGVDQHGTANMAKVNPVAFKELCDKFVSKGLNYRDAIKLMKSLDNTGACSYASVCNTIFAFYKDNPQAFKNDFGFDMFTYNSEKNYYSLNTTELLADLYLFVNNKSNNPAATLFEGTEKIKVVGKTWLGDIKTNEQQYLSGGAGANIDLIDNYLKSKNVSLNFNSDSYVYGQTTTNLSVEQINEVRKIIGDAITVGKTVGLGIYTGYKDAHGTNVKKGNVRFINSDGNVYIDTNRWSEGDGHAVFITKVVDNGVWVSSWGKKLFISFSDLQNARFTFYLNSIDGIEGNNIEILDVNNDFQNDIDEKKAYVVSNNISNAVSKNVDKNLLKKSIKKLIDVDVSKLNNIYSISDLISYLNIESSYKEKYTFISNLYKHKKITQELIKEYCDSVSDQELYNLYYDKCKLSENDIITIDNVREQTYFVFNEHTGWHTYLEYPPLGGMEKDSIKTVKEYFEKNLGDKGNVFEVTRIGPVDGRNMCIEDGEKIYTPSQRAILSTKAIAMKGKIDFSKYFLLCDILSEDISLESKEKKLEQYFPALKKYANGTDKIINGYGQSKAIKNVEENLNIKATDGLMGKAAKWSTRTFDLEGGATQLTTQVLWEDLVAVGIITDVEIIQVS